MFSQLELGFIADMCQEFDALAIMDEVYEHIGFDPEEKFLLTKDKAGKFLPDTYPLSPKQIAYFPTFTQRRTFPLPLK